MPVLHRRPGGALEVTPASPHWPSRGATLLLCIGVALTVALQPALARAADERPNILWITCEDTGPHLGCYGDEYATTPQLDRFAERALRYDHCWSNAPVCAPARTALISGLYPTSTGAEHMRSTSQLPPGMLMYPQYLRQAGYYCTNNSKEDYNLEKPGEVWDESSGQAHWKHRDAGQPFFAIFNLTTTHESQIRRRPHTLVHDPALARVPDYHPDTPEVRHDWAQYYDNITTMDGQFAERLAELEAAGVADDTIVFFYGDHGSGMPRNKRWPYDSGLHVPLLIHVPEKFRDLAPADYAAGGTTDRLVSFVDFAPTLLSLAGVEPPKHFQGEAFMGRYERPKREYVFGFRGRMDERIDMVRSVSDGRYVYIRNFHPHRIYGQHVAYMFQTPTTEVWHALFEAGQLTPEQSRFWQSKSPEELYDLESDRDEVHNLAGSPEHQHVLQRMRGALRSWMLEVRDVGLLPEDELHRRAEGRTPYELAHDPGFPIERILQTAILAGSLSPRVVPDLVRALDDEDSGVRYWGALGLAMRGRYAVEAGHDALLRLLDDESPSVRIAAADGLSRFGLRDDLAAALPVLSEYASVSRHGPHLAIAALNVIDELDQKARPALSAVRTSLDGPARGDPRTRGNLNSLVAKVLADLGAVPEADTEARPARQRRRNRPAAGNRARDRVQPTPSDNTPSNNN